MQRANSIVTGTLYKLPNYLERKQQTGKVELEVGSSGNDSFAFSSSPSKIQAFDGQQGANVLRVNGNAHDYKMTWQLEVHTHLKNVHVARWLAGEDAKNKAEFHTTSIQKVVFDDWTFTTNPDGSSQWSLNGETGM